MVIRYPNRLLYQADLLYGLNAVAEREWEMGLWTRPSPRMEEGLTRSRDLSQTHPDYSYFSRMRLDSANRLGSWRKSRGEPYTELDEKAWRHFRERRRIKPSTIMLDLPVSRIVAWAPQRGRLRCRSEQARLDKVGAAAVSALATGVDKGLITLAHLKYPTNWPNLQKRDDYRALVKRLEEGQPGVLSQGSNQSVAKTERTTPSPHELEILDRSERADVQFAAKSP